MGSVCLGATHKWITGSNNGAHRSASSSAFLINAHNDKNQATLAKSSPPASMARVNSLPPALWTDP